MNAHLKKSLPETENQAVILADVSLISQQRTADTIPINTEIVIHAEIVTEILRVSDYTFHVYKENSSYRDFRDFTDRFSSENKTPKSWEGRLKFQKDNSNKDKNAEVAASNSQGKPVSKRTKRIPESRPNQDAIPETVSVRVKICLCYPGETLSVVARKCD